jgi:prepilin-type processing-associated H-X9-DG protein
MGKGTALTLTGFIAGVATTLFIILIAFPALEKLKNIGAYYVCGTNLKGLGTAMTVYSNDYDDRYPQLPGNGPWSKELGFPYYLEKPDFQETQAGTPRTISVSWYLLVREADVSPKTLVCPHSPQIAFDGSNPHDRDMVELWDFGYDPYRHVSYAYHNPYGNFPSDGTRSAAFAVAADMSPWFNHGSFVLPGKDGQWPQIINAVDKSISQLGNAAFHDRMGQNVLFADGHTAFENSPNVGVKNDNIYTFWSAEENPTEQERQGGTAPTSRNADNDAKSETDSFLAI